MLLSDDDLIKLTDYIAPSKQIKWLRDHGWRFEVGASGRPKVSRSYADQKLGMAVQNQEPDFSMLDKAA